MCINVETCPSYFILFCNITTQIHYKTVCYNSVDYNRNSVSVHLCYCVTVPVMAERETNLQEDGWVLIK